MNGRDRIVLMSGAGVLAIMLLSSFIFGGNLDASEEGGSEGVDLSWLDEVPLQTETLSDSGELQEGDSRTIPVGSTGQIIKNITATLRWTDEGDIRRVRLYENQPDTFSLSLEGPTSNISETRSDENPRGGQGEISVQATLTDEQINEIKDLEGWNIIVSLDDAGMYLPRLGPGVIGLTDSGNTFGLTVEYEYYDLSAPEE